MNAAFAEEKENKPLSKERGPLSIEDIGTLIKGAVEPKRIAKLITKYGFDFMITEGNLRRLKSLGADGVIIKAVRQASKENKKNVKHVEEKVGKEKGWVSIMAYPKGIVFVNGKEIGYTPLEKVEVPLGQNEILVKVNGNEQNKVVIVRENETVEVSFQFEKAY